MRSGSASRAIIPAACGVLIAVGALGLWQLPLSWDERTYYLPVIEYFADSLPELPLDYPAITPPAVFYLQAILLKAGLSVTGLRVVTTLAALGTVIVASAFIARRSPAAVLFALLSISYPTFLLQAFTIKHHTFAVMFCAAALLARQRGRIVLGTTLLALGTLVSQSALALVAALAAEEVIGFLKDRRASRLYPAATTALAAAPLFLLFVHWRGLQPPGYWASFATMMRPTPNVTGQLTLALVMIGFWLAALTVDWRRAGPHLLWLVPACSALVARLRLLRPKGDTSDVDRYFEGPVSRLVAALPADPLQWVVVGGLMALGILYFVPRLSRGGLVLPRLLAVFFTLAMLRVPVLFENYYGLLVCLSWMLIGRETEDTVRSRLFAAGVLALAAGYVTLKAV